MCVSVCYHIISANTRVLLTLVSKRLMSNFLTFNWFVVNWWWYKTKIKSFPTWDASVCHFTFCVWVVGGPWPRVLKASLILHNHSTFIIVMVSLYCYKLFLLHNYVKLCSVVMQQMHEGQWHCGCACKTLMLHTSHPILYFESTLLMGTSMMLM